MTLAERRQSFPLKPGRVIVALGVLLAGLWVGVNTLGVYVSKSNLQLASSLNGTDAAIMGLRSHRAFETGDLRGAKRLAIAALKRDPTVLSAVQTLGLTAQARKDSVRAAHLLGYAQQLSRRDLQTHLWAIESHVAQGDIAGALDSYDRALRTSIAARDLLFPVLGSAIDDPAVARQLAVRLGRRPLWYDAFLSFVGSDPQVRADTAVRLFDFAARAGAAVPPAGLSALVSRSLDNRQYGSAWAAYALLRPGADRRHVRDPGFGHVRDVPAPFDWVLTSDGSIQAQSVSQDDVSGLEVDAGSGASGLVATQMQMLPPGRYRLTVRSGAIPAGGTLTWAVTCKDGPELTRLSMPAQQPGHRAAPGFTVRADCPVQSLTLMVDASESPSDFRVTINQAAIDRLPS